jgi:hypothetical protein
MKKQSERTILRNKIEKGLEKSFKKLVLKTRLEKGDLVISVNGKAKKVKASKIRI